MENNKLETINETLISKILKKIIQFFKKEKNKTNSINLFQTETNALNNSGKNEKRENFKNNLIFNDEKQKKIEILRKEYEENENAKVSFTDDELDAKDFS